MRIGREARGIEPKEIIEMVREEALKMLAGYND